MYIEPEILKEEWHIFSYYCPESIMRVILDENITYLDARKIYLMLYNLGFISLSDEFYQKKVSDLVQAEYNAKKDIPPVNIHEIRELLRTFINNIKSSGIKRIFAFYTDESECIEAKRSSFFLD